AGVGVPAVHVAFDITKTILDAELIHLLIAGGMAVLHKGVFIDMAGYPLADMMPLGYAVVRQNGLLLLLQLMVFSASVPESRQRSEIVTIHTETIRCHCPTAGIEVSVTLTHDVMRSTRAAARKAIHQSTAVNFCSGSPDCGFLLESA